MAGFHSAVVTLDVLHSGVIWGWFVTMNLWAKSLSTGAILVGAAATSRFPESTAFYRRWMPWIGVVFLTITLAFTVGDLHQPLRFWHMFVYGNPTSAVMWAGWILSFFNAALVAWIGAAWLGRDKWVDALWWPTVGLAVISTVYTAALLGQANAREIWSAPTEVAQTLASAVLAGSASYLLFGRPMAERRWLVGALVGAAALSAGLFAAEIVFAPMKSEEAIFVIDLLVRGAVAPTFLTGLAVAFGVGPALVVTGDRVASDALVRVGALAAIGGLWLVKHAFLIAPQLLPLS